MAIQEFRNDITDKLFAYIQAIESITGRETKFEYIDDFSSSGRLVAFKKDPINLIIAAKSGISFKDSRFERSIAHEITHCLLIYGMGYYVLDAIKDSSDEDILYLGLLGFVDDIAVNKIMVQNGFEAYPPAYFVRLQQETIAARHRVNIYTQSHSQLYNARYPVSRYILAWAGIKYCKLDNRSRRLINEFLEVFPAGFPSAYEEADSLRKVIIKNDIFKVDGHKAIIEYMLRKWDLIGKCSFRSYLDR